MAKTKPAPAPRAHTKASQSSAAKTPTKSRCPSAKPAEAAPTIAPGGKLGIVMSMLSRKEGATIADLVAATRWQAHSIRGAMSGTLGKKCGLTIERTRADGVSTYRIIE